MNDNSKPPVQPMSKKRLTKEQATETIVTLRNDPSEKTRMVYEFDVGKGWEVLDYNSLKECFDKELPNCDTSYLYRLVRAARTEQILRPNLPVGQIPERILRPLTALKNPDDQIKVWKYARQLAKEEAAANKQKLAKPAARPTAIMVERAIEHFGLNKKRRRKSSARGNNRNFIKNVITKARKLSDQELDALLKSLRQIKKERELAKTN